MTPENKIIGDNFNFTCEIGPDDVIYLSLEGDVTEDHIEEFKMWGDRLKAAMVAMSTKHKEKVLTLIDMSKAVELDEAVTKEGAKLMQFDAQYATKTALFGASPAVKASLAGMATVLHRDNFKLFPDREKAVAWLLGSV